MARTAAENMRNMVARRAEIGELPPVADPARKARCRNDLLLFGTTYAGSFLARPPCDAMRTYASILQESILSGGLVHVRLPRGQGKTTWIKIAVAWAVSYGHLRYPVLFGASAEQGKALIADLWAFFDTSGTPYAEDFPEVAEPIAALEGKVQRCAGQTYHGERTNIKHTADAITLPTMPDSPASGAMIISRGAGQSVRGLVRQAVRPDFCLWDDIQSRADAMSPTRTGKLEAWVTGDCYGLAGAKTMAGAFASTPIAAGDISQRFADRTRHPELKVYELPLVTSWGGKAAAETWKQYDALWGAAMAEGDPTVAPATEYLREHADTLADAACLDPLCFDPRVEVSGIQHARNLFLRLGAESFDSEYQLKVIESPELYHLEEATVLHALNGSPRRTLPEGTAVALAFVDVMQDKLRYTVTAFGRGQVAAVIDYGVFPPSGALAPKGASERQVDQALARGLTALARDLSGRAYRTSKGGAVSLHALWIDSGWHQPAIAKIARALALQGVPNASPCKGFSSAWYLNGKSKATIARGTGVDLRDGTDGRFYAQNADLWKETAQRAFLEPPLAPGSCSLFGRSKAGHHAFAVQIVSEKLQDKANTAKGYTYYRWTHAPGAQNHWLDCLAGTFAMASWYRFWSTDDAILAGITAQPSEPSEPSEPAERSEPAKPSTPPPPRDRHDPPNRPTRPPVRRRIRSALQRW